MPQSHSKAMIRVVTLSLVPSCIALCTRASAAASATAPAGAAGQVGREWQPCSTLCIWQELCYAVVLVGRPEWHADSRHSRHSRRAAYWTGCLGRRPALGRPHPPPPARSSHQTGRRCRRAAGRQVSSREQWPTAWQRLRCSGGWWGSRGGTGSVQHHRLCSAAGMHRQPCWGPAKQQERAGVRAQLHTHNNRFCLHQPPRRLEVGVSQRPAQASQAGGQGQGGKTAVFRLR